jgi:hypothetical protein
MAHFLRLVVTVEAGSAGPARAPSYAQSLPASPASLLLKTMPSRGEIVAADADQPVLDRLGIGAMVTVKTISTHAP